MSTKVKGLFKGLRYISQIFDEKEDDEIQIGFPTDVKHVAHIGMDGSSANTPSWMNDFKSAPDASPAASSPGAGAPPPTMAAPLNSVETSEDNTKNSKDSKQHKIKNIPKSRHSSLENNNTDSPTQPSSDGSKHARRHRSMDPSSDSTGRDSPSAGTRQSRRHRSSNLGSDSPAPDGSPAAPKPGRRRKTKAASVDESERSQRSSRRSSKGDSMTDISLPDLDAVTENGHDAKHIGE